MALVRLFVWIPVVGIKVPCENKIDDKIHPGYRHGHYDDHAGLYFLQHQHAGKNLA